MFYFCFEVNELKFMKFLPNIEVFVGVVSISIVTGSIPGRCRFFSSGNCLDCLRACHSATRFKNSKEY